MTARPRGSRDERRLVGTERSLADRCRVYRTAEALEVDLIDHYDIRRRRVFFDEVQLVTLHSRRGAREPVLLLGFLALSAGAASRALRGVSPLAPFLLGAALLLGALAVLAAVFPVWVVTVFGKRTRARMQFNRSRKARSVYDEMCSAARLAQETAQETAFNAGAPPPEPPPALPEPDSPP